MRVGEGGSGRDGRRRGDWVAEEKVGLCASVCVCVCVCGEGER